MDMTKSYSLGAPEVADRILMATNNGVLQTNINGTDELKKTINVNTHNCHHSCTDLSREEFKTKIADSINNVKNAHKDMLFANEKNIKINGNVGNNHNHEIDNETTLVKETKKHLEEPISENKSEINIAYAYVTKTPNNNVCSNNELIHLEIMFDEPEKKYIFKKHIKKIPFLRYGHFLCLTNNNTLLAIGGTDGKRKFKIVEEYCEKRKKWHQINIMHSSRSNFCGICTEGNNLIIIGGEGEQNILRSVEYYDKKINTWINLPPLIYVRHSANAVILNNLVFIIGGKDGNGKYGKIHKTVEMLNLNEKHKKWVLCDSLKQARLSLAAIVFKGKIYAIGGSTGVKNLNSVEIYDTEKNHWQDGPKLNFARSCFVAFIWNGNLVVYGGVNEHEEEFINSAEMLDEKTSTWVLLNEKVKAS